MPADPILFPALDNGMLAHLPVSLSIDKIIRSTRFPDGSLLTAAAEARLRYGWNLRYENLSQTEWQRLIDFIAATNRGAIPFAFPDPIGNLLAHSGDLQNSIWLAPAGLTVHPITVPEQPKAFILTNPTALPIEITQSVAVAGPFRTCFSILAKWTGGANFSLRLADDATAASQPSTAAKWSRHFVTLTSGPTAQTRTVGLTIPPTTQLLVSEPQLEIAAAPGAYLQTGAQSGIFPSAWLNQRSYDSQSNAPGAHSITLRIESLRAL